MKPLHKAGIVAGMLAIVGAGYYGAVKLVPDVQLKAKYTETLKNQMKDPDSYKRVIDLAPVQEIEGQPSVYKWQFNAKNSMGRGGDTLGQMKHSAISTAKE